MKRKSKKKKRSGKLLFLLILAGVIAMGIYFFRQEVSHFIKPLFGKKDIWTGKKEVLVYFSDPEGEHLVGEKRKILKKDDVKEEAKEIIAELIKGPKETLIPTLPPQTKLLTFQINEVGVAKINFNQSLSKDHPGGSSAEMMTVYSIVNSLSFNFPQVKRVQILIEGKPIETIAGHLSLSQPISPKPELIRRQ